MLSGIKKAPKGYTPAVKMTHLEAGLTPKLDRLDVLLIIAILLFTIVYAVQNHNFAMPPFEDAAILMRYSQHIAQGHGIVWNIGEEPVDGATDFLFMILVAVLTGAGMPLEFSVQFVNSISHILTVVIVYIAIRKLHGSARWMALVSAAYLAIGPGLVFIATYFGTPFFALFACITWCFAIKLLKESNSNTTSFMFGLSGLITGLIRPEGVFLAVFMLLGILYMKGLKESRRIIFYFLGIFFLVGGLYFFWRLGYFGYPLPNPFYKKGGGYLYLSSLKVSIKYAIVLCLPFALAFILGFRSSKTARQTVFSLIPIVGFIALWVFLSNEMNYLGRFQYPILPIVLISWPPLLRGILEDWKLPKLNDFDRQNRITFILLIVIIFGGILVYQHKYSNVRYFRDGRYDVAVMLNEYSHKNYTIATSEAGLLPLYSNWRAIDTWGLNDQWIAHNGKITESYLDLHNPEIIMFHAFFSPIASPKEAVVKYGPLGPQWFLMVMTLKEYAEKRGYTLAAAFGDSPFDTQYYYVRSDFSESAEITRRIRDTDYFYRGTRRKSVNYAMLKLSDDQ